MKMVGITFDEYYVLDGTKVDKAREYIENANLVFLCGGDTYNQHLLFEKMDLIIIIIYLFWSSNGTKCWGYKYG